MKPYNFNIKNCNIELLANAIANGDESALVQLYEHCYQNLYLYGLRIVGNENEIIITEVIQDFFLWLAENYDKIKKVKYFEIYLYKAIKQNLKNKLHTTANKNKSHQRFQERTFPLNPKYHSSPEEDFIEKETSLHYQNLLQKEIAKLPSYQREILHLRYFEERTYEEIAQFLSISPQVARNYIYRAIRTLKNNFKASCLLPLLDFIVEVV